MTKQLARAFYNDKTAGKGKIVSVEYSLTGNHAENYKEPLSNKEDFKGTITRRPLAVYAETTRIITEKPYDGTHTAFVLSTGVLEGVVENDDVILATKASYQGSADVGQGKPIQVSYSISEGSDKNNYIAPSKYILDSGSIVPLALPIENHALATTSKTYDGSPNLSVTSLTPQGFKPGEMTVIASAAFEDKRVGTDKAITISYALAKDDANYLAPPPTKAKGTIKPKQLTVGTPSFPSTANKTYDGKNSLSVTPGPLEGVVAGDLVSVDAVAHYADREVGEDKTIVVNYSLDGPHASNYLAPSDDTSNTGNITMPTLLMAQPNIRMAKVYDGTHEAQVTAGLILSSIAETEDVRVVATATYDGKDVGRDKTITVEYSLVGHDSVRYVTPKPYSITGAVIEPKALSMSNPTITNVSKEYDGSESVDFTIGDVSGLYPSDDVEVTATGRYLTSAVGSDKYIRIAYALRGAEATVNNYIVPDSYYTKSGVITKKSLSVKENSTGIEPAKIYDGLLSAQVRNAGTLLGVVNGDRVTLGAKANYLDKNVGTDKTLVVEYFLTGPEADNYIAPLTNRGECQGTIIKRDLTVDANSTKITVEKLYDGLADALVVDSGTLRGVVGSDEVILSTRATYQGGVSAGRYKTIQVRYTLAGGADKENYSDPQGHIIESGAIVPIQLSIGEPTLLRVTKNYDGSNDLSVSSVTPYGFLPGDMTLLATATYADKKAGTNKAITVSYALEKASENYLVPAPYILYTGVITPKKLEIQDPVFANDKSKIYDGTTKAAFTQGPLIGVLARDTVGIDATATYADTAIGSRAILVTYVLNGPDAANYIAPSDSATMGSIEAKQLTISTPSFPNGTSKPYDGTAHVPVQRGSLSGVIAGESVAVSATATYENKNVADTKIIGVSYAIDGPDAGNYLAPSKDERHTGSITMPKLVISKPNIEKSKVYDNSEVCKVTPGSSVTGIVGSEDVRVLATARFDTRDVGSDKTITVLYTLTGRDSASYLAPDVYNTQEGIIEPRDVVIGVPTSITASKEYDGTTGLAFTMGKVTGLYPSDGVEAVADGRFSDAVVGTNKDVQITYSLLGPSEKTQNYRVPDPYSAKVGVITKKVLTVKKYSTVIEPSKIYDGTNIAKVLDPGLLEGVVSGDEVKLEAKAIFSGKNVGTGKNITVEYFLTGPQAGNYVAPSTNTTDYKGTP